MFPPKHARPGEGANHLDPDDEEVLGDFFGSLTIPDAMNPDGWFARLPRDKQAAMNAMSWKWHLNHWFVLKAIAEKKPM